MENNDYPALFRAADQGAISAQKTYLLLIKIEFFGLIGSAILSSMTLEDPVWKTKVATAIAITLLVVLVTRLITLAGFDRKWFSCRAIAESVKSTTWRYITKAEPYQGDAKSEEIDKSFLGHLRAIRDARLDGAKKLSKQAVSENDITSQMREIRSKNLQERKRIYNEKRVIDQKVWYKGKAKTNEGDRNKWFAGSVIIEVAAVALAFLLIQKEPGIVNPVGMLITLAAVIVAWSETKRHRELSQSYSLVVQELNQVSSLLVHVNNEDKLSNYVENAEEVISKEHKMWLAKRED